MTSVDLYCRVSTTEQADEGFSLGEQETRLRAYAAAQGWSVHACHVDGGYSGAKLDRPGLNAVIADARAGAVQKVVTYKLDRLSRSQKDTLYLIEDVFLANHVDYVSMTESFDTSTPFGLAMIGILSVFAQLEREQIKERMSMGRRASAKEGNWHGGSNAPYGYVYRPKTADAPSMLVVDPEKAAAVRDIFDLFLTGKSYNAIYKTLAPKHPTLACGGPGHIKGILRTRTYLGEVSSRGDWFPGRHEPIIDRETFDRVQVALDAYEAEVMEVKRHTPIGGHLLTSLVWCGSCGARWCHWMNRYKKKNGEVVRYPVYICYTVHSPRGHMSRGGCHAHSIRAEVLEDAVWDQVCSLRFEDLIPDAQPDLQAELGSYSERLAGLDRQLRKLIDLYSLDSISLELLEEKTAQLNAERARVSARMAELQSRLSNSNLARFADALSRVNDVRASGSPEEQQELIRLLIERVVIEPDGSVRIEWKI